MINLVTTPGKYWFYWPLLGWGLGIIRHAYGVLRHQDGPWEANSVVSAGPS